MATEASLRFLSVASVIVACHRGAFVNAFLVPSRLAPCCVKAAMPLIGEPSSLSCSKKTLQMVRFGIERSSQKGESEGSMISFQTMPSTNSSINCSKVRRLKDRMWVRETLEDLTAAEFASTLDSSSRTPSSKLAHAAQSDTTDVVATDKNTKKHYQKTKKSKRAVDFENLVSKLDRRAEDMCALSTYGEAERIGASCYDLNTDTFPSDNRPSPDTQCWMLKSGVGMASVVYTDIQREALLTRIMASKQTLLKVIEGNGHANDADCTAASDIQQIRKQLQTQDASLHDDEMVITLPTPTSKRGDPNLYVRDDGTVDWDGALQDRAALKKFGAAVWARINGRDAETLDNNDDEQADMSGAELLGAKVTVKIVETNEIRELKMQLDSSKEELRKMFADHTALLNSAVRTGSATANVKLATLEPALRTEIRRSMDELEKKTEEVSFQTLNYELERIFTYLDGELGNTAIKGYIPLQDRLNVAEFGLLESQIQHLNNLMEEGDNVDSDVLAVVVEQMTDFKRRLGIDYYVTGLTYDREAIRKWVSDLLSKAKKGLAFYGKGCQLFWNDLVFSSALIGRALQGYTLKPREVRTLRRTFKDVITFIPVVIILLIPLSPVGHVLVFGAIQRFYPDFFPSCFTESRQNLLSLYESTEYSEVIIKENWKEKLERIGEAIAFFIAETWRRLYNKVFGSTDKPSSEDNDSS